MKRMNKKTKAWLIGLSILVAVLIVVAIIVNSNSNNPLFSPMTKKTTSSTNLIVDNSIVLDANYRIKVLDKKTIEVILKGNPIYNVRCECPSSLSCTHDEECEPIITQYSISCTGNCRDNDMGDICGRCILYARKTSNPAS